MIRDATHDDVSALVRLGAMMAAESPRYSRFTYAPEKLERLFNALIDSDDGFLMLAEVKNQIVGVMAGLIADHWMAVERTASEFGVYVNPKHRGGTSAARMIKQFTEWARDRGAVEICLGISTDVQVEQTARFYHLLGLRQFGLLFEVPNV